jgi:23S rRNA pseudouridine955/2504/2580 synthase
MKLPRPWKYSNLDTPGKTPPDRGSAPAVDHRGSPTVPTSSVRQEQVDAERAGQRLDNFLAGIVRGVPKSHLYQLIRSGQLRVNGGRRSPDYRLQAGDIIRIPPVRTARGAGVGSTGQGAPPVAVRQDFARLGDRLPVLHEDESILVIDKPESVAVHGGSGVSSGVIERLRAARPAERFLELVHRLDRETSGVLVVARKRSALLELQQQWRERAPAKRYLAVTIGRWPLRQKTLDAPLLRKPAPDGDRRVEVDPGGRPSVTRVRGLEQFVLSGLGEFSLVEVDLETGRTHQIRVHLAHAGFPIVGDDKYGNYAVNRALAAAGFRRMYLHAAALRLRHPQTGQSLTLEAAMPAAFRRLLDSGSGKRRVTERSPGAGHE